MKDNKSFEPKETLVKRVCFSGQIFFFNLCNFLRDIISSNIINCFCCTPQRALLVSKQKLKTEYLLMFCTFVGFLLKILFILNFFLENYFFDQNRSRDHKYKKENSYEDILIIACDIVSSFFRGVLFILKTTKKGWS